MTETTRNPEQAVPVVDVPINPPSRAPDWTVNTLSIYLTTLIADLEKRVIERFFDRATAVEAAFNAAQKALDERAATLDKEFREHLEQVRHETAVSFAAAEKAISKNESLLDDRHQDFIKFREYVHVTMQRYMTREDIEPNRIVVRDRIEALQQSIYANNKRTEAISAERIDRLHQEVTQRFDAEQVKRVYVMTASDEKADAYAAKHDNDVAQLRNEVNATFSSNDKALNAAFTAAEKALAEKSQTLDKEFRERLAQVQAETLLASSASEKAITKAEAANEKRFEAMNDFRGQLQDQAASFIPRIEAEQRIGVNTDKIESLTKQVTTSMSRAEIETRISAYSDKIDAVIIRLERNEGRSSGMSSSWGILVAAVGMLATIVTVVILVAMRT